MDIDVGMSSIEQKGYVSGTFLVFLPIVILDVALYMCSR